MGDPTLMLGTVVTWGIHPVGKCSVSEVARGEVRRHECSNFDTVTYAEFTEGLIDVSSIHVECYHIEDDAGQYAVASDDGTAKAWSVVFPNGWGYSGSIGKLRNYKAGGSGAEGHVMFSFDIIEEGEITPAT